ncbi:CU044_2847 family protein [Symbioplanes lichenis]|uniref:CU044_2847 family protein n=1 Tax=Symbioplanes lichenis TaxID=1629072 RepID=UPI002738B4A0|nr:CU044_2847 family protein [Actinoplanes lichenis]
MSTQVVQYATDDGVLVSFEVTPPPGFRPASTAGLAGQVSAAAEPVIAAARDVLEKARAAGPDQVEVKFGVKVTGTANWLVAKAATEGSFEVTLTWRPEPGARDEPPPADA